MKLFKKSYGLVVLVLIILFLVWKNCESEKQLAHFSSQISKFKIGEQEFSETLKENNSKVLEQEQIILTQKQAIENNLLELKELKKIKSQVKLVSKIQVDSVFIEFKDTLTEIDPYLPLNPDSLIKVPKRFNLDHQFYSLNGVVVKKGILLDSIQFNNSFSVTIGNKSMGFFKSPKPIVNVDFENPYISTLSMQNIIIQNELKWYEKKPFYIGIGFFGGIFISNLVNQ